MKDWNDISVPLIRSLPLWPGSPGFEIKWLQRIDKDHFANVSQLSLEVHTGTHLDAPRHFVPDGSTIDQIPLSVLCGECQIIEILGCNRITADHLEQGKVPDGISRLLIRTDNSDSKLLTKRTFFEDYCALDFSAAQWLVEHQIKFIGIDYLSIQRYEDGPQVHQLLLENEVIIAESLNLMEVTPGFYEMICLPIHIAGAEASPARVIIRSTI